MYQRIARDEVLSLARQYPVLTITGPRQSGKSTLAQQCFAGLPLLNLEAPDVRRLALEDPRGLLARYPDGVIIDEIQRAPELTSYLQPLVDRDPRPGRFILTGSQQFELMAQVTQSLAGRTALLKLLPLSLSEMRMAEILPPTMSQVLFSGFYPRVHAAGLQPTQAASFYVSTYLERDLRQLANIEDLAAFERFLRLCAAHVGQMVNATQWGAQLGISHKTVASWLSMLEASFIVFRLQPHHTNVKKRLVKTPKLYFYDTGLACYLLSVTAASQLDAHPLRGALFENMIVADTLKQRFNSVQPSNLFFYRDHQGLEIDLVQEEALGVSLMEIKSGQTFHPEFASTLHRYQGHSVLSRTVVYGGDDAFRFRDVNVLSWKHPSPQSALPCAW